MVDKRTVRRGYDDLAATYAAERTFGGRERAVVDRFLGSLPASARLLDVGCGDGAPVLARLGDGDAGIGVDVSREQLRRAGSAAPGAARLQADMTRLPLGDGAVDAVTALHSLIHVPSAEHRRAIGEFARVLGPGGRLLVSEGPAEWRGSNPDWLDSGVDMEWHVAGADATRAQLRDAGFEIRAEWTDADDLATDEDGGSWVFLSARLVRT